MKLNDNVWNPKNGASTAVVPITQVDWRVSAIFATAFLAQNASSCFVGPNFIHVLRSRDGKLQDLRARAQV